jgi:aquaporin Z
MSSHDYSITALSPSASLGEALTAHWREYLMEAAELGALMLCICLFGTFLYSKASPMARFALSRSENAVIMGMCVAATTLLIIHSPFGRRSGAHFNPAITLTYLWLGRIHRWDALSYVAAQFSGSLAGVFVARQILGLSLSAKPVHYVVTIPGSYGRAAAFIAEFLLSALLMGVVLFATNHRTLARFSPLLVAAVTVFYFAICSSISGFSVNPARTFSSAIFAWIWWGIWIYFAAPCLGMLAAAALYIRAFGPSRVYCAKVFHDLHSTCPFPCRFHVDLLTSSMRGSAHSHWLAHTHLTLRQASIRLLVP